MDFNHLLTIQQLLIFILRNIMKPLQSSTSTFLPLLILLPFNTPQSYSLPNDLLSSIAFIPLSLGHCHWIIPKRCRPFT